MSLSVPTKLSQLFKLSVIATVDEDGNELSLCVSDPVYDPDDSSKLIGGNFAFKKAGILLGTIAQYYRGDGTWQTLNKAAVGLSNVDNTADAVKPVSTAQAAADQAVLDAAKAYSDALETGLLDFRGNYDASTGLFPTTGGSGTGGAVVLGDVWRISVAGTIVGKLYRVGDSIYAATDAPAQVAGNWGSILLELGYNPEDVANKVTTLTGATNQQYPSALLVKTALDGKISDVANGATAAGAVSLVTTPVTSPTGINRVIARLRSLTTDLVFTAPATEGDPVTLGIVGTTLKFWEEVSTAIDATTQRLTWRPKDPNGTFVRANTVQVIAVPRGITFRDPLESGAAFPTGFTTGIDLQIKGATGTNSTHARGGYCFGEGNSTGTPISGEIKALAIGIGCSAITTNTIAIGVGSSANGGFLASIGVALGNQCNSGGGTALGRKAIAGSYGLAIGSNTNFTTTTAQATSIIIGANCSSAPDANNAANLALGTGISMTALNSMIISPLAATDQGIVGFHRIGRKSSIPLTSTISNISDWTNTAWRDVPNSLFLATASDIGRKFSANFLCLLDSATSSIYLSPRKGVILIECWRDGSLIPTVKVLQGGDPAFLTYIDFQFIASSTGVKLQWKIASNPTTAAVSDGRLIFGGELIQTESTN